MAAKSSATSGAQHELVITRVFHAPRELVFRAWTEPERVAEWWGPKGFTSPVCRLDVRPGGAIRIDMRGPDGAVYPMKGVFHEITGPERIVFTATAHEDPEGVPLLETLNTITFAEHDEGTEVTLRAVVVNSRPEGATSLAGMEEGWTQSLDRLRDRLDRNSKNVNTASREIAATRTFNAPRELVFDLWTDPKHIAQWWGPNGFTTTIHQMDVRPGGVWQFVMHGPDGADYNNKIVYTEIVRPERLVYEHISGPRFQMTVIFAAQGDKTILTARMLFESAAERDHTANKFGAVEGLGQTLGRLEKQLAHTAGMSADRGFAMTRVFDAPRDLVFKAWTEPERLARWWGPKGFAMGVRKLDLRPGGTFHYSMRSPDGREMWGKFVYREIVPPERLVFVNSFADPEGNPIRNPFNLQWPLEVLSTLTFSENDGKTTLTGHAIPVNATEEEIKTFEEGRESMQKGWAGTLDQLADYLAKA